MIQVQTYHKMHFFTLPECKKYFALLQFYSHSAETSIVESVNFTPTISTSTQQSQLYKCFFTVLTSNVYTSFSHFLPFLVKNIKFVSKKPLLKNFCTTIQKIQTCYVIF